MSLFEAIYLSKILRYISTTQRREWSLFQLNLKKLMAEWNVGFYQTRTKSACKTSWTAFL